MRTAGPHWPSAGHPRALSRTSRERLKHVRPRSKRSRRFPRQRCTGYGHTSRAPPANVAQTARSREHWVDMNMWESKWRAGEGRNSCAISMGCVANMPKQASSRINGLADRMQNARASRKSAQLSTKAGASRLLSSTAPPPAGLSPAALNPDAHAPRDRRSDGLDRRGVRLPTYNVTTSGLRSVRTDANDPRSADPSYLDPQPCMR